MKAELRNEIEKEYVASYLLTQLNTQVIPHWLYMYAITYYDLDDLALATQELHLEACFSK